MCGSEAEWFAPASALAACVLTRALTELYFLTAAAAIFVVCLIIQYVGYDRLLVAALHESDPALRQRGLKRWVLFALALQSLVIVGVFAYAFAVTRAHRSGFLWIAPPLGALLGTALPYQLAVMRLARAGRE